MARMVMIRAVETEAAKSPEKLSRFREIREKNFSIVQPAGMPGRQFIPLLTVSVGRRFFSTESLLASITCPTSFHI
jgi:hypothetical protein